MRANSLAFRLIASAALWSALALVVAGAILTSLNRSSAEHAFDDRMGVYLKTLIGALADRNLSDPNITVGNLGEPRFEQLYSGWYWQVREPNGGQVVLSSPSLFSDVIDLAKAIGRKVEEGVISGAFSGPGDKALRVAAQDVTFNNGRTLEVLVAGDAAALEEQIAAFRNSVIATLAVFGVGLIGATAGQIVWGLRPLDRVRRGLAELRSGRQARFEENLPAEIEPLVAELNALLETNREVIERARTHVGNLAHALKTPLSVIINEARASKDPLGDKIAEQGEIMRRQVDHYLDRARIAAQSDVIGAVTDVPPTITRLVRAMRRIHADRNLAIDATVPERAQFKGEQQDLEEIVGNLVDNACKWSRTRVVATAEYQPPHDLDQGQLIIVVEDDGPGLAEEEMAVATARGRRLDESKPGSGLGLSIVTDLVGLYRGEFTLSRSAMGGLRARVVLPAA